jgi:hypothetical protein
VKVSTILKAISAISYLVMSVGFKEEKKYKPSFPNVSKMLEKELEKVIEDAERELYI